MTKYRPFGLAMMCSASVLAVSCSQTKTQVQADVVYTNGKIYTLDAKSSVVSAVAVLDGRLIGVGSDATVRSFVGPKTEVVDLKGAAVIPGLNDTHNHTVRAGEDANSVKLLDVKSIAEMQARIKEAVAKAKPGQWIRGEHGWHPTSQLAEHRYPTAADLDAVSPNNPVQLGGHVSTYNSAAMKLAGIDRNTRDPEGGVIRRDAQGNPTGIFEEKAGGLVGRLIPPPTPADIQNSYVYAMKYANAFGLTSVVDPGLNPTQVRALQRLMQDGKLTLRYAVMYSPPATGTPQEWDALTNGAGASSGFGNEWLKFDAIGEMSSDGGMTYGTAFTRDGYANNPNYHGVPAISVERLNSNVSIGNKNDWRFSVHAVGDGAVDRLLNAYEAADKEKSIKGRRFAVMHGSLIQKDQLERMKRMGVILELQSIFMWDKAANVERNLGTDRANRAVPARWAIDTLGINNVSLGTDFSTNLMDPWINLYVAVTRKDPTGKVYGADQVISREEALRLYTVSGAYVTFDEKIKGPLEVGKLADMVVLDRDYMTVPAEQIKDIKAMKTIVGGKVVFSR